jgi:hypothetical protein
MKEKHGIVDEGIKSGVPISGNHRSENIRYIDHPDQFVRLPAPAVDDIDVESIGLLRVRADFREKGECIRRSKSRIGKRNRRLADLFALRIIDNRIH